VLSEDYAECFTDRRKNEANEDLKARRFQNVDAEETTLRMLPKSQVDHDIEIARILDDGLSGAGVHVEIAEE
jgi:hypothetical protein